MIMQVIIKAFLVAIIIVTCCGSQVIASVTEIHEHKSKDIGNSPVPKIALRVLRDQMDGVNINVTVAHYHLNAPDTQKLLVADGKRLDTTYLQGHAHVFVNGAKKQRLYGENIHIPQSWLKEGVNQVAVSLNSHQHENWTSEDQNIVGSIFFDLSKDNIVLHNFTSQPIKNEHAHH